MPDVQKPKPEPGKEVVLKKLPPGLLDGLPDEDQKAIAKIVGKSVLLLQYDDIGRAELEFTDSAGVIHFIYVEPEFIEQ
ncbi:MAG: hypothetical protein LAP21_05380 [Acidobacteriia bacterium]|nr:hypothetical protein [Terriglobia bacterium]